MVVRNTVSELFVQIKSNLPSIIDKMCLEMNTKDDVLRTKVLKEVNEDFHQADKLNYALKSEILYQLVQCFEEENSEIRELASRAILKVANTEMGRVTLV